MMLNDLLAILPTVVVTGWAVLLLLVDLWVPKKRKGITALLAATGLTVAMGLALAQNGHNITAFNEMISVDGFALFLEVLFLAAGLAAIALAYDYLKRMQIEHGEYYVLMMFSIAGMMLMAQANDLVIVFLALELLSIPIYVLAGIARPQAQSEEAALKYFLLGTFSSGFVLYGIALIFAATAHTDLPGIYTAVNNGLPNAVLFLVGAALLLVGFGFKMGAVPFHMWVPDVYQGAPTPVSGFMSVGVKAAGLAALLRVFITGLAGTSEVLVWVVWVLAALSMLVGNVLAMVQNNIKRLLAYSSIASGGYLLMAFVPFGNASAAGQAVAATLFYVAAYALTSYGAWAVVAALEKAEGRGLMLEDYSGLGRKYPWLAAAMTVFLLSYAGVPLTMGFWGKFYLFRAAVDGGFGWLAAIGLITSVVAAFYYLRVMVVMYMRPGEPHARSDAWLNVLVVGMALAVVVLAFFPHPLLELVRNAVMIY